MKNKREDRFEAIVDQFVKNDLIAQEEYSYYLYGVKHLEVLIMTTGGVLLSGILLKEILFTVVFLITFSLLRMDVISEGVALFINVSLMALYWCIASILNKDPK